MAFAVINPFFQFFDNAGEPLVGGTVETYESGTSTPKVTYQDATLATPNSTTITLDSAGRCSMFVADGETFKYILKDSDGVTLSTKDGVKSPLGTRAGLGAVLYPQSAAEIAAGVTPTNYYESYGQLERYGAVGDGSSDDATAWQNAVKVGGYVRGTPGKTYRITAPAYLTTSDTTIDLRGCAINQVTAATQWLYIGRTQASSTFVKTDHVRIHGGRATGAVTALGTPAYGITIVDPADNPYVNGNGCDDIEIVGHTSSGFTGGLIATAASNIRVHTGCSLGGMIYHSSLGAGGYGALFQTCFDVEVCGNQFKAESTDRHAIYISTNSNRGVSADNICVGVVISNNRINWSGTAGVTGFEAPIEIRSAGRTVVDGNTIAGGYGGIEYDCANGTGSSVVISNNTIRDTQHDGTHTRSAINVQRDSGTATTRTVSITGNTISIDSDGLNGIQVTNAEGVTVTGNTLRLGDCIDAIIFTDSDGIRVGSNEITITGNTGSALAFAGGGVTNVTVGRDTVHVDGGALTLERRYYVVPSSVKYDFPRTATVSWSSGTAAVVDNDNIIASAASDTNGFTVTFENWVESIGATNVRIQSASSTVASAYHRLAAGQVLTVGVKDFAGVDLPAASNDYAIAISVES
jgi:hypothetical protein